MAARLAGAPPGGRCAGAARRPWAGPSRPSTRDGESGMNKRGERAVGDARRAVGPGREAGIEGGPTHPGSNAGMNQVLVQGRPRRALRVARRSVLALAAAAAVAAMVSCAPPTPVFDPHTMDSSARASAAEALPGTKQAGPSLPTVLKPCPL